MRFRILGLLVLLAAGGFAALIRAEDDRETVPLSDAEHQLEGKRGLDLSFDTTANPAEFALVFEQKLERKSSGGYWNVALNGKSLGRLEAHLPQPVPGVDYNGFHRIGLAIPAGVLKDGKNRLTIAGNGNPAVVRNLLLERRSLQQALRMGVVTVSVRNGDNDQPLPARLTVVDSRGQLVKLYNAGRLTTAVRPGLLYTLGEGDSFSLPAGNYTIYATCGMEWGVARQPIVVSDEQPQSHTLTITREVDTSGYVACDSHIHVLPASGHGNATFPERMITIAGEGIEVAVATDHNHISEYRPHQHETGTHDHFHAIAGDEVTTRNGHFTAFPLDPAKAVPGGIVGRNPLYIEIDNWEQIIGEMRTQGAEVVLLNHPYWPTMQNSPLAQFRFNRKTGGRLAGPEKFTFDGLEVAQPANKTPDAFYAVDDWLALLNRGTRLTAVGATDSHTVNDPVGQARTYLESSSDEVTEINRDEVCRAFVEGRASAAAGIFATMTLADRYRMGDLVPAESLAGEANRSVSAKLRVASPSWVRPTKAFLYVNGRQIAERPITTATDEPTDTTLDFEIELPPHDAHVVALILGDDITLPGWTTFGKSTQAITNPVYVDVNGDKVYSSPRETARQLIAAEVGEGKSASAEQKAKLLKGTSVQADPAVRVHLEDLLGESSGG